MRLTPETTFVFTVPPLARNIWKNHLRSSNRQWTFEVFVQRVSERVYRMGVQHVCAEVSAACVCRGEGNIYVCAEVSAACVCRGECNMCVCRRECNMCVQVVNRVCTGCRSKVSVQRWSTGCVCRGRTQGSNGFINFVGQLIEELSSTGHPVLRGWLCNLSLPLYTVTHLSTPSAVIWMESVTL